MENTAWRMMSTHPTVRQFDLFENWFMPSPFFSTGKLTIINSVPKDKGVWDWTDMVHCCGLHLSHKFDAMVDFIPEECTHKVGIWHVWGGGNLMNCYSQMCRKSVECHPSCVCTDTQNWGAGANLEKIMRNQYAASV